MVGVARGDRGEEAGIAVGNEHGRDAVGESPSRAQLVVQTRTRTVCQHDLGEAERGKVVVVHPAEAPSAGDVQEPGAPLLVPSPNGLRAGIACVLDRSRACLQDRLGSIEDHLRVDGTHDRECRVAGAPAIAHLVEIVDADRCERGPGAEDRIRERMIDAVQGLGEELPDAPALLRLVRKLAQHDRSLAIEIADRRSGGGQPCHGGERRRDIGRHDDRIDRRLLTRRRRPELAAEALDLAPRSRPSRVRKIRCSCRCAPPRAAPCLEPTPTVSRAATTGPGRSSAATRSPASVRPMIGTGQPGVVLRACSTVATYATCVPGCKSWSRAAPLPSCFGQRTLVLRPAEVAQLVRAPAL